MAKLNGWLALTTLFHILSIPLARAQYYQDYAIDSSDPTGRSFTYTPTPGIAPGKVINLDTIGITVHLVYNCRYMREICTNAETWYTKPRGINPHPKSNLPNDVFGFDMNTGEAEDAALFRNEWRRKRSCPAGNTASGWFQKHGGCPEAGSGQRSLQEKPMRNDGEWFTTAAAPLVVKPGTTLQAYLNDRKDSAGNVVQYSNIMYTCDEFPPATWVEGGSGWNENDPLTQSETRCAALSCLSLDPNRPTTKAEQNWQGLSHNALHKTLEYYADTQPGWATGQSVVLFKLHLDRSGLSSGIAARVYVMKRDANGVDQQVPAGQPPASGGSDISQAKRSLAFNGTSLHHAVSHEELKAHVEAGRGHEIPVYLNGTVANHEVYTRSQGRKLLLRAEQPSMFEDAETFQQDFPMWNASFGLPYSLSSHTKPQPRRTARRDVAPLLKRASSQELQAARDIVKKAQAKSNELNKARIANPLRNSYSLKPGTVVAGDGVTTARKLRSRQQEAPPLLEITPNIAAAAALVAEADAIAKPSNATKRSIAARSGSFWMEHLARKGSIPWGNDPEFVVFRNVLDYGAIGDGVTDDTKAINKAMGTNSTACGKGCNGSTTKNTIVYFPPGKYLISSTIAMPYGTQVIGDAINRPTLLAAASFIGLGVLSNDEYTGADGKGSDGGDPEYYINTANFYRTIRNIIIDIRQVKAGTTVTCLHYQVAQATSTQNLELIAAPGSEQIGMFAENGSGGGISDITFTGGGIGLKGGEQQFTAQRLTFNGCTVGVQVIWDWGWVWKSVKMNNVGTGFKLVGDGGVGNIGSASIMDSSFTNVDNVVLMNPITATPGKGSTGLVLEKINLSGTGATVVDTAGKTILGSTSFVDQWLVGPVYEGSATARSFSSGGIVGSFHRHPNLLDPQGNYFERSRPQYEDQDVSMFVHTKDWGCAGDGTTDDTASLQMAIDNSVGKILFVDAGSYILTSTIHIPPGVRIVGETWSQLVASGPYFSDASQPKTLIRVGSSGDTGIVEMQDLIFTTRGATAGAIMIEWNIAAEYQGGAGIWDCHVRIGGATGTQLTPAECPPVTSGINSQCSAASLMMHLTSSGSGYFENMWLWGADHMIDDPDLVSQGNPMVQTSIYVARGFLIESTKPTWLYGTASEHAVFYQYNFHGAANIYAGMLQTESPYYQPTPPPPAPFANVVGLWSSDPDYTCSANDEFNGCDESWAVIMTKSKNIFISSAGIYSWFSTYSQSCIDNHTCQRVLMLLKDNLANVRIQNLVTIGAKYMAVMNGKGIPAIDNLNVDTHPNWSQISLLDVGDADGNTQFDELLWVDPKIWQMEQPRVTCAPPCKLQIPPWPSATSTVNYPLVTVSQGSWTSTITQPPITISEWVYDPITVTQASGLHKRDIKTLVKPRLAETPVWPAFVYNGGDGRPTTTSATIPFPTPAARIDPDTPPAPPSGHWARELLLEVIYSLPEFINQGTQGPFVDACTFPAFGNSTGPGCFEEPWWGWNENPLFAGINDFENAADLAYCPIITESSSTTSLASTTPTPTRPTDDRPLATGDPRDNSIDCFSTVFGEAINQESMFSAAGDFCNQLEGQDMGPGFKSFQSYSFRSSGVSTNVDVSLEIKPNCKFPYDNALCNKYLSKTSRACGNCDQQAWHFGGVVQNNCLKWMVDPNHVF